MSIVKAVSKARTTIRRTSSGGRRSSRPTTSGMVRSAVGSLIMGGSSTMGVR